MGVKFIFIISLMHTLSDKVMFVQRKLKPEEEFTFKNGWSSPSTFWHRLIYDLVPKGVYENRTKGVENKVDDTLKLVVFLDCAQC